MKKFLSVMLTILMLATMIPFAAVSVSAETVESDLVITTAEELKAFAAAVNAGDNYAGKTVTLGANIDLENEAWTPIGSASANPFCGTFDGQNYVISNLSVTDGRNFAGLFGRVGLKEGQGPAGKVMNVTVNNATVAGNWYVGVISGVAMNGDIENCDVTGTVNVSGYCYIGGVVGRAIGNYKDCDVSGDVTIHGTGSWVGGIVGEGYSNFDNCTVIVNDGSSITADLSYCGGIAGIVCEGTFTVANCKVENVAVSGTDTTGGIAGTLNYGVNVADSTVTGIEITATAGDGTAAAIAGAVNGNATQPNVIYNSTVTDVTVSGTTAEAETSGLTSSVVANDNYFVGNNVVVDESGKIVSGDFSVFNEAIADVVLSDASELSKNEDGTYTVVAPEAEVNGVYYATLEDAIANADGKTVTLLANVELTEAVTVNGNVTLDLAGKAITVTKSGDRSLYAFDNQGTFTLTDSVGNGSVTARGIKNYGTMVMNGGTVVACDTNGGYGIWNYGSFTMNDGTLKATHVGSYADDYGPCCLGVEAGSTATVNGGTIESVSARTYAIISNGTLNITDVTMTAPRVVSVNSGVATISGGTFTATDSRIVDGNYTAYETYYALYVVGGAKVTVNGGTFDAYEQALYSVGDTNVINITGGTFKKPLTTDGHASVGVTVSGGTFSEALPEDFCAEGFEPTQNEDGSFGVQPETPAAEVIAQGNWNDDGSITWVLTDDGVLTINGSGEMQEYAAGTSPVIELRKQIKTIVIGDGITYISNRAFKGMTGTKTVVFGKDVKSTGYEAFMNCLNLTTVELNEGLVSLGSLAFYGTDIETIELPTTLETINNRVFKNCEKLTYIAIPDSVTYIGYEVFMGCTSLTGFKWSANVSYINSMMFNGCTSLKEVTIPTTVWSFRSNAFTNSGLEVITFENGKYLLDNPFASTTFTGIEKDSLTFRAQRGTKAHFYAVAKGYNVELI